MRSQTEFAALIQQAMRDIGVDEQDLANRLGRSETTVRKIMCGDIVPSRHLEKQVVAVLKIPEQKILQLAKRRERQVKGAMSREAKNRKAA